MPETPDYKATLRLPQTDFPMKGNLPTLEPKIIEGWLSKGVYQKMVAKNKGKPLFVLPDGPPYANGAIHIGHALNKNLKDIVIKYKNMKGFEAHFIPGWDCHGLLIEHAVMKGLSDKDREKAKTISNDEIRSLCRSEAQKWVNIQSGQFQRLGVLADWQNPYLTMDATYEAEEVREFARAFKRGVVYLGTKPVYWNWTLKTALADAEVEYHNHKSPSIYVKFPIQDTKTLAKIGNPKKPASFVIWTTTPWTLPANLGICLNAEADYQLFDTGNELLCFAVALKDSVATETGLTLTPTGPQWKGLEFDGLSAQHPFINRKSLLMVGPHVTLDAGTGCVHTAPGHGADDYKIGIKYGLPILSPVDESGAYTDEFAEMKGVNIFKANPLIIEKLKTLGMLLGFKEFEHSYPHCWRSKTPLIFRATPQWFIGLDMPETEVRKGALEAMNHIQFFPSWGEARFRAMMEGRPDWCLSRQRVWGVPIPIFYCKKTGHPLADVDIMMKVAEVMEAEKGPDAGINAFYKYPPEHFFKTYKAPADAPPGFGSDGFRHGKDILDVWFDSGVCHAAVQSRRVGMRVPADLYLEGSDQHRGWFNTSLLSSVAIHERAPFKALVTHGFVTDSGGLKMSKSKGNTVDPQSVSAQSGAEILRLWTIYEDYGQDLTCGKTELERVTETYRRIRNTMRFLLGATSDFDVEKEALPYAKLLPIEKWALHELFELTEKVTAAYDAYEFYKIYHLLNQFFTVDLSAIYLDVLKDRLYTWKESGAPRKGSQTVLFTICDYLTRMMAPVLSFLAEEVYSFQKGKKLESVFLTEFPKAPAEWKQEKLKAQFDEIFKVRSEVQKRLEELRAAKTIGASLEAYVSITAPKNAYQILKDCSDLREILIVSKVDISEGEFKIEARRADGEKCLRCWTYSTEIGKQPNLPGVCPKCVEALT